MMYARDEGRVPRGSESGVQDQVEERGYHRKCRSDPCHVQQAGNEVVGPAMNMSTTLYFRQVRSLTAQILSLNCTDSMRLKT